MAAPITDTLSAHASGVFSSFEPDGPAVAGLNNLNVGLPTVYWLMLLWNLATCLLTLPISVSLATNATGIKLQNGFERVYIQVAISCSFGCSFQIMG